MAINLTYDTSNDPEAIEAQEAIDAEHLAIGERLEEEQNQLLAGKYKSAEELEQAYLQLQQKLGSRGSEDDTAEQSEDQPEEPQEDEEEEDNGLSSYLLSLSEEYNSTGSLSPEAFEELSKYPSADLVEAYLKLQAQLPSQEADQQPVELSQDDVAQVHNYVGGAQNYQQMVSWAADNFTPQEVSAFDSVMDSGDMNAISLAVQALYYRYTDAMGYEGPMLKGKAAQSRDVFRSQAEVVRAMSDPRYDNDPAYRQDIFDKLERSDLSF